MKTVVKNTAIAVGTAYLLFESLKIIIPQKDPLAVKIDEDFERLKENMERIDRSIERINQKSDE